MSSARNYPLGRGLWFLPILLLFLSACTQPLGSIGPSGDADATTPPVPGLEEQPEPAVALTAEAGAALSPVVGVGIVRILDEDETVYSGTLVQAVTLAIEHVNEAEHLGSGRTMALMLGGVPVVGEAAGTVEEPLSPDDTVATIGPVIQRGTSAGEEGVAVPLALRPSEGTDVFGQDQYTDSWNFQNGLVSTELTLQSVLLTMNRFDLSSVAVISAGLDSDEHTRLLERLQAAGVDVVATGTLGGEADPTDVLLEIATFRPDAVLLNTSVQTTAAALVAAREIGMWEATRFIVGSGILGAELLEAAGDAATGVVGATTWYDVPPIDANESLGEAFRQAYEAEPDRVAAKGYAAVWLLAEAIRRTDSSDPVRFQSSLEAMESFETPYGVVAMVTEERPSPSPVLLAVREGGVLAVLDENFE